MPKGRRSKTPRRNQKEARKRAPADIVEIQAPSAPCPVVGIGASAGGIEAFETFFSRMPADSGLAFVLVPHLDTRHQSAMTELIQRYTRMNVALIEDDMPVKPDHVYVIPPNATLGIRKGRLQIVSPRRAAMTIDAFLRSLAEDQESNAIAIILSGSGSDGALGIKAIKEHGGLTMAQAGPNLRYDSMPVSATATGLVDIALPVEDMPAKLIEYVRQLGPRRSPRGQQTFQDEARKYLPNICTLLRSKTGHDFSRYKQSTFFRRLQRRMQVMQVTSVSSYLELLRKDAREVELLFRDLLIGVTQFFRDAHAFEALEREVIPKILANKSDHDPVRIWVPGCATGEEAYSIAIILREQMMRTDSMRKVLIFATDIDDQALEAARLGRYPHEIARHMSEDRLDRFFVREDHGYRVMKDIREMCIFSVHNLIKDAPFSKLDLISCRNLLIYLDATLQHRVTPLFHFALRNGGYLFLGPAENVSNTRLFERIDAKARIFKARPTAQERPPLDLPLAAGAQRPPTLPERGPAGMEESLARRAARVMDAYSPAYVIVDDHYDILHFAGRTGKYVQPSPGTANLNLFNLLDMSLRTDVRALLSKAAATGQKVTLDHVLFQSNDDIKALNLIVEPIQAGDNAPRSYVIAFQEVGPVKPREKVKGETAPDARKDETIAYLESELRATRERLQATIEELETSNEEMKASNEEFQSVNEELQSSNEELETSKEELQSVNEELETVNSELNSKVETLERAINDRKNLLESTQIATIFLDGALRIKSFTPVVTDIFHLIDADSGRPITDIAMRLHYGDLERDVRKVLRTLSRMEHELELADGSATYMMRILPYRTVDNVIDGVVITFVDITERKRNEAALARLAAIVESSHDAVVALSTDGSITTWNAGAERLYGYTAAEAIGRPFSILLPRERESKLRGTIDRVKRSRAATTVEAVRLTKDGARIYVTSTLSPIRDSAGKVISLSAIERDVTDRRRAAEQLETMIAELNHRVKNTLATVLAVMQRTLRQSGSTDEFRQSFSGRILALAKAHELLASSRWSGAALRDIVMTELQPYRERRLIAVNGDAVTLNATAALALSMVIHELTTNAVKYGALSTERGRVNVKWRVNKSAKQLAIEWIERGGPQVGAIERKGLGMRLIERSLATGLQGRAHVTAAKTGVHWTLEIPLKEIVPPPQPLNPRETRPDS